MQMDTTEARYVLSRLIGDVARDTYISSCREAKNDFQWKVANRRYASTLVNLTK